MIRPRLATMLAAAATFAAPAAAQNAKSSTSFTGSLGYLSATGNTKLTTLSIGEALGHSTGRWTLSQLVAYVYGKTDARESANQLHVAVRSDYSFENRMGVFGGSSVERNRYAGFRRRTEQIAGLKWKSIAAPADSMALDAGGVLTNQSDVDGNSADYTSGRAAAAYKHVFSKAAYFQQVVEYLLSQKEGTAYRLNAESAVVAPISRHVGIKLNFATRYNSRPPVKFGTTDRILTTGVQVSY